MSSRVSVIFSTLIQEDATFKTQKHLKNYFLTPSELEVMFPHINDIKLEIRF